ncbi:MAG TPA: ABC transporter permease [Bryobacteraceae bacterium]|nr:ABC transporter permease [Bryobacteraceae bacterium]
MDWLGDVRFGFRTLAKNPGFTTMAVAMLALGIGINAAVFTVTNATLFKGFPLVASNNRILYITTGINCCVSYPDFKDWRSQATSFDDMAIVHGVQKAYRDNAGFPETSYTTEVSANTFQLAGVKPILGRDFLPSDETPGAPQVAILRYGFWERRYGKDPGVIGRKVQINGTPATLIGVMPQGFSFPQNEDMWVPLVPIGDVLKRDNRDTWFVFGHLKDGVTRHSATAEMETIGSRLAGAYPATNQGRNLLPHVYDFDDFFIGSKATLIYEAMWGAVGFVLLIACANLANLLLARAIGRSRELSIRVALGSGRWRIIRQLLVESVILSALGGVFGWCIARLCVHTYGLFAHGAGLSDAIGGTWFDNVLDYTMDSRVTIYLAAISLGTGLLFGLVPALRLSKLDVNSALKDGGRGATGGERGRHLSGLLVTAEVALAVVLLSGAGLMIHSFLNIYSAEPGFHAEKVLTGLLALPKDRYPDAASQVSFFDRLSVRIAAIPGIESTAMSEDIPTWGSRHQPYELAGAPPADPQTRPTVSDLVVSPSYFHVLGASLLSGRDFNDRDTASGPRVAIVNQRLASTFWPAQNPVGQRLRLFDKTTPGPWLTVVGVSSNIVQNDATRQNFDAIVYLPYRQRPGRAMWVLARTAVPFGSLATAFRGEIQALDPNLPTALGPIPLAQQIAGDFQYQGVTAILFLIFAAVALLLASAGLYAVIAHSVSRRTQEIGIRIAVGAAEGDILRLVFQQGMLPLATGLAIGLVAAVGVNRVLRSSLVHVSPADPATLVLASAVLIAAAVLGCWLPARRAMRVDPVVALRHE